MEAKRRPNFTEKEKACLVELVKDKYELLVTTKKGNRIKRMKDTMWEQLQGDYNSFDVVKRGTSELKIALANIIQRCKKEITVFRSASKATGGGHAPTPLSPLAECVQSLLPQTFESLEIPDDDNDETGKFNSLYWYAIFHCFK